MGIGSVKKTSRWAVVLAKVVRLVKAVVLAKVVPLEKRAQVVKLEKRAQVVQLATLVMAAWAR